MPRMMDLSQGSDDWLLWREKGIGGSDAPIILEESPWSSAYKLWLQKTNRIPRDKETPAMLHGKNTEPLIREWYVKQTGKEGAACAAIYDDADYIRVSMDHWNPNTRHAAEFKAPTSLEGHQKCKEAVPYHYWIQCQHEMQVMDALTLDFVSWHNGDGIIVSVERDDDFWLMTLLPAIQEFWRRVQEDAWPKPEGDAVDESPEWAQAAERFRDSKLMVRDWETVKQRAEAALRRMAVAKSTTGAGIRASWVAYKPRWEAKISAESPEALTAIMKALAPLEGKQGVGKISSTAWPPNLVLRVAEVGDE
jgi:putative phage-type endonuclease